MRVLAADGQPLYRDAIARAIRERPELELVAQAGDGREALAAIRAEEPDVAVIDRTLSGLSGEQVLNAVERDGLRTRVVLLAAEADPREVYAAVRAEEPDVAVIDRTLSGLSGEQVPTRLSVTACARAWCCLPLRPIHVRYTPRWRRGRPAT